MSTTRVRKKCWARTGQWEADDIVRIVLEQPATPRLIARKLYRWFLSVKWISQAIRCSNPLAEMLAQQYDVGQVVETILRSNLFFSPRGLPAAGEESGGVQSEPGPGLGGQRRHAPAGGRSGATGTGSVQPAHRQWLGRGSPLDQCRHHAGSR